MRYVFLIVTISLCACTKPPEPQNGPEEGPKLGIIAFKSSQKVYAFDIDSAKFLWQTRAALPSYPYNHFTYDDDVIYSNDVGGIAAVNLADGSVAWQHGGPTSDYSGGPAIFNELAISDTILFAITRGYWESHLTAHHKKTGKVLWHQELMTSWEGNNKFTTPVVMGEKIFALAPLYSGGARLWSFNKRTGQVIFSRNIEGSTHGYSLSSSPDGKYLLLTTDGIYAAHKLSGFNPENGDRVWASDDHGNLTPFGLYQDAGLVWINIKGGTEWLGSSPVNGATLAAYNHTGHSELIKDGKFYQLEYNQTLTCTGPAGLEYSIALPSQKIFEKLRQSHPTDHFQTSYTALLTDNTNLYFYQQIIQINNQFNRRGIIVVLSMKDGSLVKMVDVPNSNDFLMKDIMLIKDGNAYQGMTGYISGDPFPID